MMRYLVVPMKMVGKEWLLRMMVDGEVRLQLDSGERSLLFENLLSLFVYSSNDFIWKFITF